MHFTVSRIWVGGGFRRPSIEDSVETRVRESGPGAPGFVAGGVMPTVISKMGAERVRRRTVPRTSPMREAMSPVLYCERGLGWRRSS